MGTQRRIANRDRPQHLSPRRLIPPLAERAARNVETQFSSLQPTGLELSNFEQSLAAPPISAFPQ